MAKKGELVIVALKARHLPNRETIGKQDPFCVFTIGPEKRRTRSDYRGGQTPKWDEQVNIPIEAGRTKLFVQVFGDDKKSFLIGDCEIELDKVFKEGEWDDWFKLSYKNRFAGEVYLELTYYSGEKPPPQAQLPRPVSVPAVAPPRPPMISTSASNGAFPHGQQSPMHLQPTAPMSPLSNGGFYGTPNSSFASTLSMQPSPVTPSFAVQPSVYPPPFASPNLSYTPAINNTAALPPSAYFPHPSPMPPQAAYDAYPSPATTSPYPPIAPSPVTSPGGFRPTLPMASYPPDPTQAYHALPPPMPSPNLYPPPTSYDALPPLPSNTLSQPPLAFPTPQLPNASQANPTLLATAYSPNMPPSPTLYPPGPPPPQHGGYSPAPAPPPHGLSMPEPEPFPNMESVLDTLSRIVVKHVASLEKRYRETTLGPHNEPIELASLSHVAQFLTRHPGITRVDELPSWLYADLVTAAFGCASMVYTCMEKGAREAVVGEGNWIGNGPKCAGMAGTFHEQWFIDGRDHLEDHRFYRTIMEDVYLVLRRLLRYPVAQTALSDTLRKRLTLLEQTVSAVTEESEDVLRSAGLIKVG
ncbi:hypothetical protein BZG36_00380 [Bifiguratus adelaidae]|uniref:C2 domain-containing protein n=1 Tax=Bifiguratus adelaidae TaxID=1938954 RepID=A0A261Y7T1_9FUNG|nr:hypothetical protein BZG36_00380 [Bifiguratus adelaidae]